MFNRNRKSLVASAGPRIASAVLQANGSTCPPNAYRSGDGFPAFHMYIYDLEVAHVHKVYLALHISEITHRFCCFLKPVRWYESSQKSMAHRTRTSSRSSASSRQDAIYILERIVYGERYKLEAAPAKLWVRRTLSSDCAMPCRKWRVGICVATVSAVVSQSGRSTKGNVIEVDGTAVVRLSKLLVNCDSAYRSLPLDSVQSHSCPNVIGVNHSSQRDLEW